MNKIEWIPLTTPDDWQKVLEQSMEKPVMVYKHSNRCGISSMVQRRLEREWDLPAHQLATYFLDLIPYRNISNAIARDTGVPHESPQVIVLRHQQVIFQASHSAVDAEAIAAALL